MSCFSAQTAVCRRRPVLDFIPPLPKLYAVHASDRWSHPIITLADQLTRFGQPGHKDLIKATSIIINKSNLLTVPYLFFSRFSLY